MKKHKKTNRARAVLCALLCAAVPLCGCQASAAPPSEYRIGEDHLPSLTAAVPMNDAMVFSESAAEDGETTYHYAELTSAQQVVSE